jgi:hypothetical protein
MDPFGVRGVLVVFGWGSFSEEGAVRGARVVVRGGGWLQERADRR